MIVLQIFYANYALRTIFNIFKNTPLFEAQWLSVARLRSKYKSGYHGYTV